MRMKKLLIVLSLLFCVTMHAQESQENQETQEKESDWRIFDGFDLYFSPFLNTGNTMTRDSHRDFGLGIGLKINAVEYQKIGLSFFYNLTRNTINDIAMIADFDYTQYHEFGLAFSYRIPLTENTSLKPELGYYGVEAKNYGDRRKSFYQGNGFLVGTEYLFFTNKHIALFGGVHYNYLRFDMKANPAYQDYFADMHRIHFKIGIHFRR